MNSLSRNNSTAQRANPVTISKRFANVLCLFFSPVKLRKWVRARDSTRACSAIGQIWDGSKEPRWVVYPRRGADVGHCRARRAEPLQEGDGFKRTQPTHLHAYTPTPAVADKGWTSQISSTLTLPESTPLFLASAHATDRHGKNQAKGRSGLARGVAEATAWTYRHSTAWTQLNLCSARTQDCSHCWVGLG